MIRLCLGRGFGAAVNLIGSSLVAMLISACGNPTVTTSSPVSGINNKVASSLADGTWYGACETSSEESDGSEKSTYVILGNTATVSNSRYSDKQCNTEIASMVVNTSFIVGNQSSSAAGAYELQLAPSKIMQTFKTTEGIDQANNGVTVPLDPPLIFRPICGGGFTIDVAKELTAESCKNDEIYSTFFLTSYGLVKIDGDKLYFGNFEDPKDGSTPEKRPTALDVKYFSKISSSNAGLCTPKAQLDPESCITTMINSTAASRSKSCSVDGQSYVYGTCEASACVSGYSVSPTTKTCVSNTLCTPNAQLGTVSCVADVPNSTTASKTKSCNATGQSYVYGTCEASACTSGYSVSPTTKTCVANTLCTPNAQLGTVSCVADVPNSTTASKTKSCSADGQSYVYGTCEASACASGYSVSPTTKTCVADTLCTPNAQLGAVSCAADIPNSTAASKTKSCSPDGQSYLYGTCSLSTCKSGFVAAGNVCTSTVQILRAAFALYKNGTPVSQNLTVSVGSTTKISIGRDIQFRYNSTTYGDGMTSFGYPIETGSHTDYSWSSSAGALSRTNIYDGYSYNFIAPNQAGTYTITVTLTKSWIASSVDITDAVKAAAGSQFTAQFTVVVQ